MITPKEALKKALEHFVDTFPQADSEGSIKDISLESLKQSPKKDSWLVTISFRRQRDHGADAGSLQYLLSGSYENEVRTIEVSAEDGSFISLEAPSVKD